MDNVTHSLVGYALGRGIAGHCTPAERRAALWTSVIASNAPDIDVVIAPFTDDAKLANLLHHRGHTHTLLLALPIGIACALLFARVFGVSERAARQRLLGLGALAGALHIGFDWLNSYGVHPFFPLDDRWYYGDAVFIIEPLLLAVLAALPAVLGLHRATRIGGALIYAVLLGLLWGVPAVPAFAASFASAACVASVLTALALQRRGKETPRATAFLALGAALIVIVSFQASGARARAAFEAHLSRVHPGEQPVGFVLSPSPGNPLCWSAIALTEQDDVYRARLGALTLAPGLIEQAQCRFQPRGETTARLARVASEGDVQLHLVFERPLAELRALNARSCEARLFLQFARAPFWQESENGEHVSDASGAPRPRSMIGDLRFDNEPQLSFAEVALTGACPEISAPWVPPRAALLD
jgi:inner membrane protein